MSLLIEACIFAAFAHSGQKRKSGTKPDYIVHPLRVVKHLQEAGELDEKVLAAAVLHDTVEDCNKSNAEISALFGKIVAQYVDEVTDDKKLLPSERKKLQIINAPKKSIGASHVKLADKYDNCLDLMENIPEGWTVERVQAYFLWSRTVVRAITTETSTALYLKKKLETVFASSFFINGELFPCIPKGDEDTLLNAYYASLDVVKKPKQT